MTVDLSKNAQTENKETAITNIAIRFGIIGGLTSILVSLILYLLGMQLESWTKWISTGIMVAAIIVGLKMCAIANEGKHTSFGYLFGQGMIITLILSAITILYFLLHISIIEPDFIDKTLDVSRNQMSDKGLSQEQIDNAITLSKKFMSPGIMVLFSLLGMLFMGAIASLIGTFIYKNNK